MLKTPEFEQILGSWREDGYLFTALDRLGVDATKFLDMVREPAEHFRQYEAVRLEVRKRRPIPPAQAEDLELALFFQHFPRFSTRDAIAKVNELYLPPRELKWFGINSRLVSEAAVAEFYRERCLGELEADWVDSNIALVKDPAFALKAIATGANPLDNVMNTTSRKQQALPASGEKVVAFIRGAS